MATRSEQPAEKVHAASLGAPIVTNLLQLRLRGAVWPFGSVRCRCEHVFVMSEREELDRLEGEIVRLAEDVSRRLARWLGLVAEFDALGGARVAGFRGTAEWLAWRCGIGVRAARDHVRVARGLAELPRVREALARGELSYSKARALTRAAGAVAEERLLEVARRATAAQLERLVRSLRTAPSADLDVARRAHGRRFVDWWWDEDGSLRLCGRLPADDGAAVAEAIETAAEALAAGAGAGMPRPPLGARRADALAEIALSGCPRTQVVLHVDEAALACTAEAAEERAGEVCALEAGPAVPSETARRLACDGDVMSDLGRSRRVVSPALRRRLELRDGGCRFPGCERRHGLHAHHIHHWAHGGATDGDNLVLLCRFHHRLVHEEGFSVRRRAGGVEFARPDGRMVPALPRAAA